MPHRIARIAGGDLRASSGALIAGKSAIVDW
jgi:hypothetical protein